MNVEESMVNGKKSVCVCASCRARHSARVGVFGLVWHYILYVEPTSTQRARTDRRECECEFGCEREHTNGASHLRGGV